jgi:23S rRNA pseudouridine1911/1915/1917 synthase
MLEKEQNIPDHIEDSDDLYEHRRFIVDRGQLPLRVDKFLFDRLERVSRNKIQDAIRSGAITVDGLEVKPNHRVKPGQVIILVLPSAPKDETVLQAENIPLEVIYEDDTLLVINKAVGMVVHPGINNERGTLVNALAYYFHPNKDAITDGDLVARPSLVHRIDKDTSGLMVIPKTDYAAAHLAKQFFDHTVDREYRAIVWGTPDPPKGTITGHIARDPHNRLLYHVVEDGAFGKHAVTHYETLESYYYVSLIRCKLETGRTHQIRVHMKHIGNVLFNDWRYGGDRIHKGTVFSKFSKFVDNCFAIIPRQALHAISIGFTHPETGERMFFESNLPQDMLDVLEKWKKYLDSRKNTMHES